MDFSSRPGENIPRTEEEVTGRGRRRGYVDRQRQATGMVNDHVADCFRFIELRDAT